MNLVSYLAHCRDIGHDQHANAACFAEVGAVVGQVDRLAHLGRAAYRLLKASMPGSCDPRDLLTPSRPRDHHVTRMHIVILTTTEKTELSMGRKSPNLAGTGSAAAAASRNSDTLFHLPTVWVDTTARRGGGDAGAYVGSSSEWFLA